MYSEFKNRLTCKKIFQEDQLNPGNFQYFQEQLQIPRDFQDFQELQTRRVTET